MSDTKHTPLPWHTEDIGRSCPRVVADQGKKWDNLEICNFYDDVTTEDCINGPEYEQKENHEANAEFIVRACNSHDALLNALKGIVTEYECGLISFEGSGYLINAAIEAIESAE